MKLTRETKRVRCVRRPSRVDRPSPLSVGKVYDVLDVMVRQGRVVRVMVKAGPGPQFYGAVWFEEAR